MRDILVRLSYTHVLCSCGVKTPFTQYHDEMCLLRIIQDAEAEILLLRERADSLDDILQAHPDIIAHTYKD